MDRLNLDREPPSLALPTHDTAPFKKRLDKELHLVACTSLRGQRSTLTLLLDGKTSLSTGELLAKSNAEHRG